MSFARSLPRPRRRPALLLLATALARLTARADVPTLDHLFPPSARPGTTNELTAVGTFKPWPAQLVFNHPGLKAVATTNTGRFTLSVAPDVPPGVYLARALDDAGASAPRFLLVNRDPARPETEPNNALDKPEPVPALPAVIEGRLEKSGDIDGFKVPLRRGQTLVAWLEAFVLGSPVDAVIRILDSRGIVLAWNHDDRATLDPLVAFEAPADGDYRVEVFGFPHPANSDVQFTGNAKCIYRLHLDNGPFARFLDPAGLAPGSSNTVRIVGWNLASDSAPVPAAPAPADPDRAWTVVQFPGFASPLTVPIGAGPEFTKAALGTNALPVPGAVTGTRLKPDETDRYPFVATKDRTYRIEVQANALGSVMDPWLKVTDAQGKELAHDDDARFGDPILTWKAPANGTFIAVVGTHLRAAGPSHRYRLALHPLDPAVRATVEAHSLVAEPGKTNELKVKLARSGGLDAPLRLEVPEPPEGVSVPPVETAAGAAEATLKFITATNAPATNRAFRIVVTPSAGARPRHVVHEMATTGENNGVPQGFNRLVQDDTDWLWLTVPRPPAK